MKMDYFFHSQKDQEGTMKKDFFVHSQNQDGTIFTHKNITHKKARILSIYHEKLTSIEMFTRKVTRHAKTNA